MMKVENHFIYQCPNQKCGFRFPRGKTDPTLTRCPKCGIQLELLHLEIPSSIDKKTISFGNTLEFHALLDNIRSVFNVGSIFRTADGCGINSLYLCGITPTPEHPKLNKTGLGSENSVSWTYSNNSVTAAKKLKKDGLKLWCLEEGDNAISLPDSLPALANDQIVLIVGNEISGIDPELRHLSDRTVFIPMQGYKRSLNVAIAFSIAAYFLRYGSRKE